MDNRRRSAIGLVCLLSLNGSAVIFSYYSQGGDTATLSGLYACWLCHVFLVYIVTLQALRFFRTGYGTLRFHTVPQRNVTHRIRCKRTGWRYGQTDRRTGNRDRASASPVSLFARDILPTFFRQQVCFGIQNSSQTTNTLVSCSAYRPIFNTDFRIRPIQLQWEDSH